MGQENSPINMKTSVGHILFGFTFYEDKYSGEMEHHPFMFHHPDGPMLITAFQHPDAIWGRDKAFIVIRKMVR